MTVRPLSLRRALALVACAALTASCGTRNRDGSPQHRGQALEPSTTSAPAAPPVGDARYAPLRARMVEGQLASRDITDERVLAAMRLVPRHLFVPESARAEAYEDYPLAIGFQQTISQPYIVALMTQLAAVEPGDKVLEVGTGSGYQAAVLDAIGCEVWSIEIVEPLAQSAARTLEALGYRRVRVRAGDGYRGWPEHAPFDAIVVTAAPPRIPEPLEEQLAVGGRLVVPVGERYQELMVITRTDDGLRRERSIPVRFVPMTGEVRSRPAAPTTQP